MTAMIAVTSSHDQANGPRCVLARSCGEAGPLAFEHLALSLEEQYEHKYGGVPGLDVRRKLLEHVSQALEHVDVYEAVDDRGRCFYFYDEQRMHPVQVRKIAAGKRAKSSAA